MGAGADETVREERDSERPSSDDPADERSYEDGWYRSLSAWGHGGARTDDRRAVSDEADRTSADRDPVAHEDDPNGPEDADDDEGIAPP
jgi:hypothetical protein